MLTRMMVKRMSALGAGLLLIASGAAGQRPPTAPGMMGQGMGMGGMMQMMQMMGEGMMGPGMMEMMGQGMGMMATGGPGPAMILRMGDALDLTDEQRSRLQTIQGEFSSSVQPLMAATMEAHQEAASALEGGSPDFDAYERALRQAADQMVEAHVAMARAAAAARDVLTEEQRQQLQASMQMMRGMMGQGQSGMMGPRMRR
jgi:Spy/CpxP family protein refolding chaperone